MAQRIAERSSTDTMKVRPYVFKRTVIGLPHPADCTVCKSFDSDTDTKYIPPKPGFIERAIISYTRIDYDWNGNLTTYKVRCALGFLYYEFKFFCAPDRLVNRYVERFAKSKIADVQQNLEVVMETFWSEEIYRLVLWDREVKKQFINSLRNDCCISLDVSFASASNAVLHSRNSACSLSKESSNLVVRNACISFLCKTGLCNYVNFELDTCARHFNSNLDSVVFHFVGTGFGSSCKPFTSKFTNTVILRFGIFVGHCNLELYLDGYYVNFHIHTSFVAVLVSLQNFLDHQLFNLNLNYVVLHYVKIVFCRSSKPVTSNFIEKFCTSVSRCCYVDFHVGTSFSSVLVSLRSFLKLLLNYDSFLVSFLINLTKSLYVMFLLIVCVCMQKIVVMQNWVFEPP